MFSSLLFHASSSFLYVTLCPATLMLFALRRASSPATCTVTTKTTDFYATLTFGVFMTFAGVFGLVAESVSPSGARWWSSAAYAMKALGVLIAQLAVIQLLTPDYLFGLLSITEPRNRVPSWRIYALILMAITSTVSSLISIFIVARTPSLPSSIPTFVSICLPLPFLRSLARIVKSAHIETLKEPPATTAYTKRSSKCTELGLTSLDDTTPLPVTLRFPRVWDFAFALQCIAAFSSAFEVAEAVVDNSVPTFKLLAAMGNVVWGGGIMTIHFVITYEPGCQPLDPITANSASHDLERVADQPSEDFMTLRDPFASPTQLGLPLPPSPTAPRRKPKRRASEPLQLTRFGSFAGLQTEAAEERVEPEDQELRFMEALVRHTLFSTGCADSDSKHVHSHADDTSGSSSSALAIAHTEPARRDDKQTRERDDNCLSGTSTPTIRQKRSNELGARNKSASTISEPVPIISWHPFRPTTPPRPARAASHTSPRKVAFPPPPSSFPMSSPQSAESGYSVPVIWSTAPSAYQAPPSPSSSDSGSSFVSPPPTPTPGPSGSKPGLRVRSLVPSRSTPILAPPPARRRGPSPF